MLTTHRADVNRLDTSYSAIVLDLKPGEIAKRVCYVQGIQAFQFSSFERLRDDDVFIERTSRHAHFIDSEARSQRIQLRLAYRENRVRTKCKNQYYSYSFYHCSS